MADDEENPDENPEENLEEIPEGDDEQSPLEEPVIEEEAPPPPPPEPEPEPEAVADEPPPEEGPTPHPPRSQTADPLNTEFLYYSAVLKTIGPALTKEHERSVVILWIKKLFRPEYQSSKLRSKRNKYLAFLTTAVLNDAIIGPFLDRPPEDVLVDLKEFHPEPVPAAAWEVETTWQETLQNLPDSFNILECSIHEEKEQCKLDHSLDTV